MSSPPRDDDEDETVLRPGTPLRPPPSAASPGARGPDSSLTETRSGGGDPHSPTLSAGSLASGAQGVGNALPLGSFLGEFELTEVVGEGGFGIVYLATDHSLQRRVAVKEYMPSSLAERSSGMQVSSLSADDEETFRKGLDSFINEARLLAQFDHPALVKVHRFWEANGTAYMVMPFYEGPTLKETLRDLAGPPDEAWLLGLLDPLTQALAVIHAHQCYHRDIAPDNILLLAGSGRPLLLDFGAARRVIGDANQALTVILKPGYAPLEQYAEVPGMTQGPWTDVYALAAVLYFAIMGKKPPAAVGRLLNDQYVPLQQAAAGRYSVGFLAAIDHALAVKPAERTSDIDAFRSALGIAALARNDAGLLAASGALPSSFAADRHGATATQPGARPVPPVPPVAAPAGRPATGGRSLLFAGVGVAGLVLAAGVWWWFSQTGEPLSPAAPAPTTATQAEAPAPADVPSEVPTAPPVTAAPAPAPTVPPSLPAQAFSVVGEFGRIVRQQTAGFEVEARSSRRSLRIDKDPITLSISSSRDGYYYVLTHAPDGQLLMFFPNQRLPTNRIRAGQSITLPPAGKDPQSGLGAVGLIMTEPPGLAQLLVIVSANPRDFSMLGDRRAMHWSELPTGNEAEQLARRQAGDRSIYAGLPICPAGGDCADDYGAALVELAVTH